MADEAGSKVSIEAPALPFPIFRLSAKRSKYMLYDIDTVTWLRQTHHILGVQIGGMPQFPQQNVFFGLPLELMPEEAHLLVEKGLCYVVDDLELHHKLFDGLVKGNHQARNAAREYQQGIESMAKRAEHDVAQMKAAEAESFRGKKSERASSAPVWNAAKLPWIGSDDGITAATPTEPAVINKQKDKAPHSSGAWSATPATSSALVREADPAPVANVDVSPSTYAIFKQLHSKGYYMSPGLRFGCQFMAYPGDPLRFHSHFLCSGAGWDEEFDLLDIVGGGRLGTGVKKGYLLGGEQADGDREGEVRTFCVEWGGL